MQFFDSLIINTRMSYEKVLEPIFQLFLDAITLLAKWRFFGKLTLLWGLKRSHCGEVTVEGKLVWWCDVSKGRWCGEVTRTWENFIQSSAKF